MRSILLQTSLYCAMVPGLLYAQPSVATTEPPLVEIGGSMRDPGDQLFAVFTARFLSDGRIIVAETHDARVRLYDARGRHVADIGGRGPGPGELTGSLQALTVGDGDTLLMLDESGARLRFLASGHLVDDTPLRLADDPDARFNVVPWGVLRDGRVLLKGNERLLGANDGRHVQNFQVLVYASGGAGIDTAGTFAAQEVVVERGIPWPTAPVTPLLWAPAIDDDVWLASPSTGVVRLISAEGREKLAVESRHRRVAVSDTDIHEMVSEVVLRGATANDRRVIREWATALPRADRAPAFRGLFTDSSGRLWIERWVRSADGAPQWDVHDASGRRILTVTGPPNLRITDAREELVIGVIRDSDDRELVRVHRLAPAARPN